MIYQNTQLKFVVYPQPTGYDSTIFVQKYIFLISSYHKAINPDSFVDLVQTYSLKFDKKTHADHIMTQTQRATYTSTILPFTKAQTFRYGNSCPIFKRTPYFSLSDY